MSLWAAKRKLVYGGIFVVVILIGVGVPTFFFLYEAPTCFDGKQNGTETGIDCGGSCRNLCQADKQPPTVLWKRIFQVSKGIYTAVAFVENRNVMAGAIRVSYSFKLYDENSIFIAERRGETYILPHDTFVVLESGILTQERIPERIEFEFTKIPDWLSLPPGPVLAVTSKSLRNEMTVPRLEATVSNTSLVTARDVEVTAILYDGRDNAMAAARTYIDEIPKNTSEVAIFTWPNAFLFSPARIEIVARSFTE